MAMSSFFKSELNFVCPLPLYHIFALLYCMTTFEEATKVHLILNPKDLDSVVAPFNKDKIYGMCGVNTLFAALADY